jgi:pimeloyl-ACP methyl ester carboxylesterase
MTEETLYHEEWGPRVPLVLLHGFPFDHTIWTAQGSALAGAARVLAPDLPGFGRSAPLAGDAPPTVEAYARRVLAWADEQGLRRFVLGGHSMGGYVAFALARLAAERLAALALIATRAGADSEAGHQKRSDLRAAVAQHGAQATVDAMLPTLLAPGTMTTDPDLVEQVRATMLRQAPAGLIPAIRAMAERPDSTPDLPGLPRPVLIVQGAADATSPPSEAEALHTALPQATLVLVPDAGHLPMLEAPDMVTAALRAFLAVCAGEEGRNQKSEVRNQKSAAGV